MSSEEQSDGEDQWRLDIGVDTPEIDAVACTSVGFGHDDRSSNRGTRVHDVHYQHPWCVRSIARDAEPAKTFPDETDNLNARSNEAGLGHIQSHTLRAEAVRTVEAPLKQLLTG